MLQDCALHREVTALLALWSRTTPNSSFSTEQPHPSFPAMERLRVLTDLVIRKSWVGQGCIYIQRDIWLHFQGGLGLQVPAALLFLAKGGPDTHCDRPITGGPWGAAGAVEGPRFLHLSGLELSKGRQDPSEGVLNQLRDWDRPLPAVPGPLERDSLSGRFHTHAVPSRPTCEPTAAGRWAALTGVSLQHGERPGWLRGAGGGLQSSAWSLATSSFLMQGAERAGPNRDSSQKDGVWPLSLR